MSNARYYLKIIKTRVKIVEIPADRLHGEQPSFYGEVLRVDPRVTGVPAYVGRGELFESRAGAEAEANRQLTDRITKLEEQLERAHSLLASLEDKADE